MKKKIFCVLVGLTLVLFGTQAFLFAGGQAEKAVKRIAVVTPYMANATTAYVIKQFQQYAEDEGWKVTVSDTAGDFGLLVSRIEDAVTQKVDALVLGMGDPVQMVKGLKAASEAGIPVFGLDAGVTEGVLLNVTSDNTDLGTKSAEQLAKAMGEKGNVILFTHDPHPGVRERAAGAAATFKKYPGIKIIEKVHIKVPGPVEFARKVMEDLLTAYPQKGDISGVWAGWDEPAYGATQAIVKAGREEIKVVGIDGTDFAKAEIDKGGPFIATIEQDFDGMAEMLVGLMKDYFEGKKPEKQWYKIPGNIYP
ncbi:MAG: sugar ABC transporter substrate-binding protein [Spirochaetes bacterium]|nr:MAG: sugar ABC transporter substrate-binding protein [Spirochaetota bacterium]